MITYANDRKLAEYPFFDVGQTPFPAGCIKYLGICLKETTTSRPVYASAITISMDGILVSICRETTNANEGETLGSVYATATDGSASMELSGGTVSGTVSMIIDKELLQSAYGSYNGKFYLDPMCVSYMSDAVAGTLKAVGINGTTYGTLQQLDFSTTGSILAFQDLGVNNDILSVMLCGGDSVNDVTLVETPTSSPKQVTTINDLSVANETDDYPTFSLVSGSTAGAVVLTGSTTASGDVVVELTGTTGFPNCYTEGDEA